jgi:hypothetical protein
LKRATLIAARFSLHLEQDKTDALARHDPVYMHRFDDGDLHKSAPERMVIALRRPRSGRTFSYDQTHGRTLYSDPARTF